MKCFECEQQGLTSTVTVGGAVSTLMGGQRYYDEEGALHDHDPNVTTTAHRCSNGHTFDVMRTNPCPAEGCSFGTQLRQGRVTDG